MELTKNDVNLKAAVRQLAVMRGQLSCFQRGCVDLMRYAGPAQVSVKTLSEDPSQQAGNVAFDLMAMVQHLQKLTQELTNQLRAEAGMPPVGETETQASVNRIIDNAIDELREEMRKEAV